MMVYVPATSANLGCGFDSLGLAVNLRNQVRIIPNRFHSVKVQGEGSDKPKIRASYFFTSVFYKTFNQLTSKKQKYKFEFYNQIPISRGLGSSSAVICSAIALAYLAADLTPVKRDIINRAFIYENHPDNITPAVIGGFCSAVIENDKVFYQKCNIPSDIKAVLVIPSNPMSSNKSRAVLPITYSREAAVYNLSRTGLLTSIFYTHSWNLLKVASKDKFHQKLRMQEHSLLFKIQRSALSNGALMSTLSGSGSTIFNLCISQKAQELADVLSYRFSECKVLCCDFDNDGLILEP